MSLPVNLRAATSLSGLITTDTTLYASNSPYMVIGDVTVNSGVTLTIEPGTTVSFNPGFSLTINGRLLAEGNETNRIRFAPGAGATSWNRLDFRASPSESRVAFADIDGAAGAGNVRAADTSIVLDHVTFSGTLQQLVTMDDTSCTIRFCHFPSIQNYGLIHFVNLPPTGHALIASNLFGTPGIPATSGYSDIIDFTGGNRPGPIVQFIGNVFLSGVDDCLDLDGTDAHIEGNIFINVRQDAQRNSGSYPITTGANGSDLSQLVVCRNIFYNCEHMLLVKDHGSMLAQNNTVLRLTTNTTARTAAGAQIPPGIIDFGEPWRGVPGGDGVVFEGNIVWDLEAPPFNYFSNGVMFLAVSHSLIQGTNVPNAGNLSSDPMFVSSTNLTYLNIASNLALMPGSPCIGTGPNGLDMGALVPGGASISGEPSPTTTNRDAKLTVAGPGIYAYKWRLNDGPWSGEVQLTNTLLITPTMFANAQPIVLTNLSNGAYTVRVIGKNSAGAWQDTNSATVSKTWTVQTIAPPLIQSVDHNANTVTITFVAQAGQTYSLLATASLSSPGWQQVAEVAAQAATGAVPVSDNNATNGTAFYRLVTRVQ